MHAAFLPIHVLALAAGAAAIAVTTTPHDSYSSSIGVLGCKIDTNRVAYWPSSVGCDNICVRLSYGARSVNLLRVDQSGGAYDISYDAWVYLQTGDSATANPLTGGGVAMDYEEVDASECAHLIHTAGSKLPLSASNSMNFVSSCLSEPSSWVAQNHVLYNICDSACSLGYDETCMLDLATSNQPSCPHTLGLTSPLTSAPVYNIEYESGKVAVAGTGAAADSYSYAEAGAGAQAQATSSAAAPTTSSTGFTSAGAVFVELSSSSTAVAQYSTAPLSATTTPTTSYPMATSSSQSTSAKASESRTPTSTSSTTISAATSYGEISSGTTAAAATTARASTKAASTMSVITVSTSPGTASTSSSTASSVTTQPAIAGHPKTSVPFLALVSSIAFCWAVVML